MRLGEQSLIVECKFTRHPLLANRWGKRTLRASHLNQLFAYLSNVGTHWTPPPAGLLLYAAVDGELDLHYRFRGRDVLVRTLDLARPWRDIHAQLERLLMDAFRNTRGSERTPQPHASTCRADGPPRARPSPVRD
ncbi:MAG: hypothetical protein M5U28_52880 [Sandaracinaceae bacterium]|nr:hypothetical protein [Sandaracinaceae bacterium]